MQFFMKMVVGALVWAGVFACLSGADSQMGAREDQPMSQMKSSDDVPIQMDGSPHEQQMVKRGWRNLHQVGWGKRAWHNLQSAGWGKRASVADPMAAYASYAVAEKRPWQKFQGGWGKRLSPEDEWAMSDGADRSDDQYDEYAQAPADFDDLIDEEKRAWRSLTPSWGKRATSDWESFRGSWGKRDPAWNNLKGLWGKRSMQDRTQTS